MSRIKWIWAIGLVVLFAASCSTTTGVRNASPKYIPISEHDVEVLGTVETKFTRHGFLGIIPEISLLSWGDNSSYVALLEKAKRLGADDVVNIKEDIIKSSFLVIYNSRTWVAAGLAVRYLERDDQ